MATMISVDNPAHHFEGHSVKSCEGLRGTFDISCSQVWKDKVVAATSVHAHVELAEWKVQRCTAPVHCGGSLLSPLQPLVPGRQPLPRLSCGRVLGGEALVLQQRTSGTAAHLHHPVKLDIPKLLPPEHGQERPVVGGFSSCGGHVGSAWRDTYHSCSILNKKLLWWNGNMTVSKLTSRRGIRSRSDSLRAHTAPCI